MEATKILCVDDEYRILRSLQRNLRHEGYELHLESCPVSATRLLNELSFQVIIADQRMPKMFGTEFLKIARSAQPKAIRILLTGYSEPEYAIAAINEAAVWRYVQKPWDRDDLIKLVRAATTRYQSFHKALAKVNSQVEEKSSLSSIKGISSKRLQISHLVNNLIAFQNSQKASHAARVEKIAFLLCEEIGLKASQTEAIRCAALLSCLSGYHQTPGLNQYNSLQGSLFVQCGMTEVQVILQAIDENYDGSGVPNKISGRNIPLGARILSLIKSWDLFENNQNIAGGSVEQRLQNFLIVQHKKFDPEVCKSFKKLVYGGKLPREFEVQLNLSDLKPGAKLAREMRSPSGILLLKANTTLTQAQIEKVQNMSVGDEDSRIVYIYSELENQLAS